MAAGPRPAQPVSDQVDVSLGTLVPRQGGIRLVGNAVVEGSLTAGTPDRRVADAQSLYREAHYRPGWQFETPQRAGLPPLLAYRARGVSPGRPPGAQLSLRPGHRVGIRPRSQLGLRCSRR